MIKVAVLDDYQNIFPQIIDLKNLKVNMNLRFSMNHF